MLARAFCLLKTVITCFRLKAGKRYFVVGSGCADCRLVQVAGCGAVTNDAVDRLVAAPPHNEAGGRGALQIRAALYGLCKTDRCYAQAEKQNRQSNE